MAKLSVTKDEINVMLSEQEVEKIITAHVTTWLEAHMDEHVDDTVELKEHIETKLDHAHNEQSITIHRVRVSFSRNNIEDEEHEIDLMD
jgi:nitrogen fixation protein FixH